MSVQDFDTNQITAAILAGGEGSRVDGRDKGLIVLCGRPLVAHVAAALAGQAGTIVVCANRHAQDYAPFGKVLADGLPGFRGPLAGIAAALAQCATPWLLTVPVDAPRAPPQLARILFAAASAAKADAAVAYEGARSQPMFALYRSRLAESASTALALDLPVWRWQQQIRVAEAFFDLGDDGFTNLNSNQEIAAWEHAHADQS
ncbi:MAG: molybdenum cofactor guanylyltransferase MobA [Rudaea sp.]